MKCGRKERQESDAGMVVAGPGEADFNTVKNNALVPQETAMAASPLITNSGDLK